MQTTSRESESKDLPYRPNIGSTERIPILAADQSRFSISPT